MKTGKKFLNPIFIFCLIVGLLGAGILFFAEYRNTHRALNTLLKNQAAQLETNVIQSLRQVYGLQAVVIATGGQNIDLQEIGPYLVNEKNTKNILLAPGGVVSEVYPLAENQSVIGLNLYSEKNASHDGALMAKQKESMVVTGPYELVQGGLAISGRIEVYIPQEDGSAQDWGIVSVTLNFPEILKSSATDFLEKTGYNYRVSKFNEDTGTYSSTLERNYADGHDHEEITFSIYDMQFQLAAYPERGFLSIPMMISVICAVFPLSAFLSYMIQSFHNRRNQLREKATKDSLTGLLNRDSAATIINHMIKNASFKHAAFMLIDLDHFKSINDLLGHQTGDRVLFEAAEVFRTTCRSNDVLCRLGGDEFVLFLAYDNPDDFLKAKAEEINRSMRKRVENHRKVVDISCSIGISIAKTDGNDFLELYKNADKALYLSKERGRDRTSFFSEIETGR